MQVAHVCLGLYTVSFTVAGYPARLLDNLRISQFVDCQLADWTSRGLVNSQTRQLVDSQTGQLADATGNFACLVFIFWPFIDVLFLARTLKHILHNASDSVDLIMST